MGNRKSRSYAGPVAAVAVVEANFFHFPKALSAQLQHMVSAPTGVAVGS